MLGWAGRYTLAPCDKAQGMDRMGEQEHVLRIRDLLRRRRKAHREALWQELERLTAAAAGLGVQRIVLFGSMVQGNPGLTSDLDLLLVWDTPLGFLARTAELYRCLQPRVAADLLVYTPDEMERMVHTPFVRRALERGKVLYEA
jgi:predicted nucleotidyltransferase